jgi:hypothetical protein
LSCCKNAHIKSYFKKTGVFFVKMPEVRLGEIGEVSLGKANFKGVFEK